MPVRSTHGGPLPIPNQPGGMLHPRDGRQAVLPVEDEGWLLDRASAPMRTIRRSIVMCLAGWEFYFVSGGLFNGHQVWCDPDGLCWYVSDDVLRAVAEEVPPSCMA